MSFSAVQGYYSIFSSDCETQLNLQGDWVIGRIKTCNKITLKPSKRTRCSVQSYCFRFLSLITLRALLPSRLQTSA